MKIYTKTGDSGKTSFVGGERVNKNDLRIEAYGTLDELNSIIGVTMNYIEAKALKAVLEKVQHELFTLGAELASLTSKGNTSMPLPVTSEEHVKELEHFIDELNSQLEPQTSFLLPKGTKASTYLHLTRTTCRKAERLIVTIAQQYPINPQILIYINRLSDLLYIMARYENKEFAEHEQQPIYRYFENKK